MVPQLCYKCGQMGCSYWSEHRALVLNSQRHKHFGGLLEAVVGQRIWLFPVWLTAVQIYKRQDLNFFVEVRILNCTKNSLVDYQHEHALMHG